MRVIHYIGINSAIRSAGILSVLLFSVLSGLIFLPLSFHTDTTEAAPGTATESTITLDVTNNTASVDLTVSSTNGTFATSTANNEASFSVTTNNYTGYTLSISAADDTGTLDNGEYNLSSIASNLTESEFDTTTNNGKWGYKPSKYNSLANTDFIPSPTTEATTLDVTSTANNEANSYTIGLGARADYSSSAGTYTKTFTLTAVGNPINYSVTYNKNTEDTVTNMPYSSTNNIQSGDTSSTTITLSNLVPVREGYTFKGWCSVATSDATCSGVTYNPNGGGTNLTYGIDKTTVNNTTLYAMWKEYNVTISLGEHVTSIRLIHPDYGATTLTPESEDCKLDNNNTTYTCTATMHKNVVYTLASSFAEGYTLDEWSTDEYGTLGSTTSKTTTYVITDTATLSVSSKQKTGQTTLLPGQELNAKMKTLAEGESTAYDTSSSKIKSLKMSDNLPADFVASTDNTVSTTDSEKPIYIFFDNTNNTGIMYFYSEDRDIYMNQDSSHAFRYNTALSDISAVANWDTGSVTNMIYMFYYASTLTNIDALSGWNTSSVTNMSHMFHNARALTNINGASGWDTGSVTNMSYMFQQAFALTNIDALSGWNTGSVTNMSYMFSYAYALTNIDGASGWGTGSVTNMSYMFSYAFALTNIDGASGWGTGSVTNMSHMFDNARALTNIDGASSWETGSVTNMSYMFYLARALTNINVLSGWETGSVTNMSYMFSYAYALTNIDGASGWDTGSVTNMSYMFYYAYALTNIDALSDWNTSGVTNMSYMFYNARALTNINVLSGWDTGSVTNMSNMFYQAYALTNVSGADNWDISKVTSFTNMLNSAPSHPNFTKRLGTWNTDGAFTPSSDTAISTVVELDEHVKSISFTDPTYGTRTIAKDGDYIVIPSGVEQTITAHLDTGYTINTWSTTNGTVGPNTLSSTYQSSSDDTLVVTSTTASTSTVTLNIDSHVSSVSFSSPHYDTQTITTNNNTVTLTNGVDYDVTIEYEHGYTKDSITATSGTIGSDIINGFTYNTTSNDTLTITTTAKSGTATLLPGQQLNAKMKTLAEGKSTAYDTRSSKIKSLKMSDNLPADFVASTDNTVSTSDSEKPIYIFFDNTNDAGIMYFYTEARDIYMNQNSDNAFNNNRALTDISAVANWSTGSVTNMSRMFNNAFALTDIDALSGWDTGSVTNMSYMFSSTFALTNINALSGWDTGSVTNMSYMFFDAFALTDIDALSGWDTSGVTNMSYMFSYASALTNIDDASGWDTGNVTDMSNMFSYASALTNIDDASGWDTGNVTDMSNMFSYAYALTNINALSGWDTGSVTNMSYMFFNASALTNIDGASGWDTGSVTNMNNMFYDAYALTDIDGASDWETGGVTNMSYMFYYAYALTNIDGASDWDTGKVTNMSNMFQSAYALTNVSGADNWDISKVTSFDSMFNSVPSHPNFTKRLGTWSTGGTFTPSSTAAVTITIDLDEHTKSVSFTDSTFGTRTITKDGDYIVIPSGAEQTITATTDDGYAFSSWSVTSGTIGSTTTNPTTFTSTTDATITATSEVAP